MISEDRKRKLSRTARDENGSIELDKPQKKHRKSEDSDEETGAEDGFHSIGKKFSSLFTWLFDVTTKNYFVESAMSALNLRSRQNGRNKPNLKPNYQLLTEEEDEEEMSHPVRCDLKRTPLRESYKKSQNYLTLPSPPLTEKRNSFSVRNMSARVPKRSSNALLEKHKVIEHPFKASQKFRKPDFHDINNFPGAKMGKNDWNDHFELDLSMGMKTNSSRAADSKQTPPVSSSNHSKLFTNASSPPPKAHVVGTVVYRKQGCTASDIVQLQERDQYKLLLENFTKCSVRPASEKRSPTLEGKEVQTNQFGSVESPLQQAFRKKTLDPCATSFLAKYYYKEHSSGNAPFFSSASKPTSIVRNVVMSPRKAENEDEVIIAEVKFPPPRSLQTFHPPLPTSPFFSPEWLSELKKTFDEEGREKVRVIRDQEEKIKQYHELRAARLAEKEKALEQQRVADTAIPEAEVEDISDFPELTPKMEEIIDDAFNPEPPEEVLCVGFNISVSRKDIETLAGLNWLNDEIIYFYMNLLMERSKNDNYPSVYAFNTFFYPKLTSGGHSALKRWTRKMDIFSYDFILVPVHMGMHWCLAVIDFRHKKIRYYDSMGGQNTDCLHALRDYLKDESMDKKKAVFDMSGWVLENVKNIPHQMNGSDCGMFTLKYAEYITRDAKITFTQEHMQYFRRRMVYEILTKQLL